MQLVCKSAVSAVGQDAILGAADGERAAVSAAIGPHCVTLCVPAADPVGAVISHVTATKASVTPPHAFGGSCYLRQVGPLKDPQRSAGRALGDPWRLLAVSTVSGSLTPSECKPVRAGFSQVRVDVCAVQNLLPVADCIRLAVAREAGEDLATKAASPRWVRALRIGAHGY